MKFNPVKVKILTVCYILILAGIIFIANRRSTAYILGFVGSIPFGDKLGHFFLMGILSFLVNLILDARDFGFGKIRYLLGSLIVAVIVTIEEFSQLFIRGRSFDWTDLVADFLGILVFGELARLACNKLFSSNEA
ncbi:MAG: VanZ family protein [Acidobacteriota bacterium]